MTDDQFWMQGTTEYQNALSRAEQIWGNKATPELLNASAATILIHMDKLRENTKREGREARREAREEARAAREEARAKDQEGWRSAPPVTGSGGQASSSLFSGPAQETAAATPSRAPGPYAPTEKQVMFFEKLVSSSVFTAEERKDALDWLATKATRKSIQAQIDWLKQQIDSRKPATQGSGHWGRG